MKKLLTILTVGTIVGSVTPNLVAASSYSPNFYGKSAKITETPDGTTI